MKHFLRDDSGATAIEYSLIAAIMAVALIAAFPAISSGVKSALSNIGTHLNVF